MENRTEKTVAYYDRKLEEFKKLISFDISKYFTPLNVRSEKERFFKEKNYNPRFKYNKVDIKTIRKASSILEALRFNGEVVDKIYRKKKNEFQLLLKAIESLGAVEAQTYANKIFEKTSSQKEEKANRDFEDGFYIKREKKKKKDGIGPEEATRFIEELSSKNKLPWKVAFSRKILSRGVVSSRKGLLLIREDAVFKDEASLKGFIAHEIHGHVYRYENGKKQPYGIFKYGFPNYLKTEEGLASYNKMQLLLEEEKKVKRAYFALRVIAAKEAEKKSFRETYDFLYSLIRRPQASFSIALRAKRGLSDTSKKGVFLKDTLYYRGLLEVEKFLKEKGEIEQLYYGKSSIADLEIQNSLSGLVKPQIPSFFTIHS